MKTDTILVGMTLAMLLLALPAAASDYTLGVFGNANEDDTINMQDVTYTELIILEYRDETELSDAKYDGKINMQDVTQIELVILGRELELTFEDDLGEAVTVHKPVERIALISKEGAQSIQILKSTDRVVLVPGKLSYVSADTELMYPELSKLPSLGGSFMQPPDYEVILDAGTDLVIPSLWWTPDGTLYPSYASRLVEMKEKLPGVTIFSCSLMEYSGFTENVRKLGYVLDRKDEADEFIDWYNGQVDAIESKTEGLTDDEKTLFLWTHGTLTPDTSTVYCREDHYLLDMCGGRTVGHGVLDIEWIITQNPDVIIAEDWSHLGYAQDDTSEIAEVRDQIMSRPEFAKLSAVQSERVHLYSGGSFAWGPSHIVGIQYIAKWLHPDLFEDMDPQTTHQEFLEMRGIDFDVYEDGVLVYPPLES